MSEDLFQLGDSDREPGAEEMSPAGRPVEEAFLIEAPNLGLAYGKRMASGSVLWGHPLVIGLMAAATFEK